MLFLVSVQKTLLTNMVSINVIIFFWMCGIAFAGWKVSFGLHVQKMFDGLESRRELKAHFHSV